ncbi:hypothetical protein D9M71_208210 [compost metagenome]
MAALDLLEAGQQLDAEVRGEQHRDQPRRDQRDADDPEHVAGVFARGGASETVGHEADGSNQGAGQHRGCGMAPGVGGGLNAAVALLHLHHHHLDGDDGVVHQQPQRQDQRAQGDAVEVLAGRGHDHEDHRQGQRHRHRDHHAHPPAHADEAHQHDHQQRDEELDHELVDRGADVDGLIGDLAQTHAQRQLGVDRTHLVVQGLAQIEAIPALAHDDAQQQGRFAAVADQEGRRVFIAAPDRGDVRQLQRAALRHHWRVADLLQLIEGAIQAQEHLRPLGFHGTGRGQGVLPVERGEHLLRADAQGGQALMGELDEDALGLLADDINLLHPRHVQQPLAQHLRVAHQPALRFAPGLEREQGEGDVGILVVDHRADHAGRQRLRLVADLLARLVELLRHFCRWSGVKQAQRREGQARSGVGFAAVVPAQLLQAFFDLLGDLVLHLLRRSARPRRDDRQLLDRKRRVFRTPQLEKRQDPCDTDQEDQEHRDRTLANGERRKIEAPLAHGWLPATSTSPCRVSLTSSPSRSRCAPNATTCSPTLRSPATRAASSLTLKIRTGLQVTFAGLPAIIQTPAPLPGS